MVGHFNVSFAYKPLDSMEEIMARANCYMKGKEINDAKMARYAKERKMSPPSTTRISAYSQFENRGIFKPSWSKNMLEALQNITHL